MLVMIIKTYSKTSVFKTALYHLHKINSNITDLRNLGCLDVTI